MQSAPGMDTRDLPGVDQRADPAPQIGAPVEVVLPVHRWHAGMREDLGVGLLDFPVVGEIVRLVVLLRRAILVRAVAGIVVLEKGDRLVLPGLAVGVVADHPDAGPESIPGPEVALVVLQGEECGEIEDAAGGFEPPRDRGGMPDPAALLGVGAPIVLT